MIKAAMILHAVNEANGTNEKMYILKKHENTPDLKEILKFIYNPYFKTGISSNKLKSILDAIEVDRDKLHEDTEFVTHTFIMSFLKMSNTGSDVALRKATQFIKWAIWLDKLHDTIGCCEWVAKGIITQSFTIGVSTKTLNKVYGKSFIPVIGCMLGTHVKDMHVDRIKWPCIVTEKLDGARRILVKESGNAHIYSRSGILDEGLVDIIHEAKHLPDNTVYDGELLAIGNFKNSIELRQATNGLANSKGVKHGLTFNVFDMIQLDDFFAGKSEDNALTRKRLLAATFRDYSLKHLAPSEYEKLIAYYGVSEQLDFIRPVPILGVAHSMEDVTPIVEIIWKQQLEGVMLNTVKGFYEIKRSKELIKIKYSEEYKVEVIGCTEGTGKNEDKLGSLIVNYKGNRVGVGSGFTDAQRKEIWDNIDCYLNRIIEIEAFGESNSKGSTNVSLNCPIFKRFKGEE